MQNIIDTLSAFLADPVVSFVGYAISFIAGIIAIVQYFGKSEAEEKVKALKIELIEIQRKTKNENTVNQGEKSQYFQENSGPVSIKIEDK